LDGFAKWASSSEFADEELDKAKGELAGRGRPDRHADLIDWLMDQHGVPEPQRQELFFAILRAHVAKWETIRQRTLGNFAYISDDLKEAPPKRLSDWELAGFAKAGTRDPLFRIML